MSTAGTASGDDQPWSQLPNFSARGLSPKRASIAEAIRAVAEGVESVSMGIGVKLEWDRNKAPP